MPLRSLWVRSGWVATGLVAIVAAVLIVMSQRAQDDADGWVYHTMQVVGQLRQTEADIGAVESNLRGYLLLHQPDWLAACRRREAAARADATATISLVADNPPQRATAADLAAELERHIAWTEQVAQLAARGNLRAATAAVAHDQDEAQEAHLNTRLSEMLSVERSLLTAREHRAVRLRRAAAWLGAGLLVVIAGQLVASAFLVRSRYRAFQREQETRRRAQEYAESILSTLGESLLVLDTGLRVVSANRSFHQAFSTDAAAIEGRTFVELTGGIWNIPELIARIHAVVDEHGEFTSYRLDAAFPGRGTRSLLISGRKVYRPGNHAGMVLLVIDDDTERLAAEQRLRQINAELEGFAYSVAHDLRAPLRGMQGFSEALLEDYGPKMDEVGRRYAEHIAGAGRRMDELIRDLLEYSRLARSELALSSVPLGQVLSAAQQQIAPVLEAAGAQVQVEGELPAVMAHFSTLVQMVANLLGNAAKFVPDGQAPQVRVRAEARGPRQRLWVEDNGIGIPAQFHERIFGVFERLHPTDAYPGTGIGLAIVRKGAERMGGLVGVESATGAGSRFWIELVRG